MYRLACLALALVAASSGASEAAVEDSSELIQIGTEHVPAGPVGLADNLHDVFDDFASREVAYFNFNSQHALIAPARSQMGTSLVEAAVHRSRGKYGFYLHTYGQAKACVVQLRDVRRLYPKAPVYIMSDGGMNFTGICKEIGNCLFQWRPPANDRWNPQPFLRRFKEAAEWLQTSFVILLEPDVTLNHAITHEPRKDAGGLKDSNTPIGGSLLQYVEELGQKTPGHSKYKVAWDRFGLTGGSYLRTTAVLDAFNSEIIDWKKISNSNFSKDRRLFSSDVAMPLVLAAKGYTYYPWEDNSQVRFMRYWGEENHTTAFQHHGADEGPKKPHYDEPLGEDEKHLVTPANIKHGQVMCQGCVWATEDECWKQEPVACPTGPYLKK